MFKIGSESYDLTTQAPVDGMAMHGKKPTLTQALWFTTLNMSIRDSNVVIIEVGRTVVRAGLGLYDLLKTPTIVRAYGF